MLQILAETEPFDISPEIDPAWGWLAVAVFTGLLAWLCIKQARYLLIEEAWPWWLGGVFLGLFAIYSVISFIGSLLAGATIGMLFLAFLAWLWMSEN